MTTPDHIRRMGVLYVDDDPGTGRLVQRHLERSGYRVCLAADGAQGIALAASGEFDAIVLDHYMPGQDGLEVLASLRGLADSPPVIFVTAAEEPRIAVAALKEGAADYVTKDVQGAFLHALDAAIRRAVEQERLRREKVAAETELRASRDRLEKLAAQQALLLKEVNHRVANSLQLINALMMLQAKRLADPVARGILGQAVERVEAVSLVHRRLYTSDDVQFVAVDQYLAGLVEELRRAGTADPTNCQIELHAEPVRVETDKAVPIGLIVNELVTNALKYAYPATGHGIVRVRLSRADAESITLVVEDDGVGLSEPVLLQGSGLGTVIVRSMADTLQASVDLDRSHRGTRYVVRLAA